MIAIDAAKEATGALSYSVAHSALGRAISGADVHKVMYAAASAVTYSGTHSGVHLMSCDLPRLVKALGAGLSHWVLE